MLYYVLIGLCLSLLGVAGLQMMYLFYLERIDTERQKRIVELEHRCGALKARLASAETRIEQQDELLESLEVINRQPEEVWADLLED